MKLEFDPKADAIYLELVEADVEESIEMAFALYGRGLVSLGIARRLAKLDKWTFLEGLAERQLERHYGENELKEDIDYANNRSE